MRTSALHRESRGDGYFAQSTFTCSLCSKAHTLWPAEISGRRSRTVHWISDPASRAVTPDTALRGEQSITFAIPLLDT